MLKFYQICHSLRSVHGLRATKNLRVIVITAEILRSYFATKESLRNNFPFLEHMTVQPEREGVACSELHTSCLLGAEGCVKGS
jgi:hypothetical protein